MADVKHYGVLGMKWGRRKGGGSVTVGKGVRGALKEVVGLHRDALKDDISKIREFKSNLVKSAAPSKDYTVSRQLKKKPVAKLSNEELKVVINRLQLEKQLRDLDKGSVTKGKGIVSRLIGNLVAKGINTFAQQQAGYDYAGYATFASFIKDKAKKG